MKARLSLICLAALTACGPVTDVEPAKSPSAEPSVEAVPPLEPVGKLAGEYRVAGINDASIDLPIGVVLSISDRRMALDGPCGGAEWVYQLAGKRLHTVRVASPDQNCLGTGRSHSLTIALVAALDRATQAGRTPSNGITLSGGGRLVTLYSQ